MNIRDLDSEVAAVARDLGVEEDIVWAAPVALYEAVRRIVRRRFLLAKMN